MIKLRDRFDRREEFGGLSIMKTWGLATFGSYIAACITLHPGDMPEYLIPSQERSTIVFSAHGLNDPSSKREYFPWEARTLNIRPEDVTLTQSAILDTIFEYEQHEEDLKPSALGDKIIYAAIMASTLVWDGVRSERLQLAKSAAERLSKSAEVDLSPEIECLNLLLSDNDMQYASANSSAAKALLHQATRRRSEILSSSSSSSPASSRLFDICTVCGKHITWKNLLEATCVAGHPYSKFFFLLVRNHQNPEISQVIIKLKLFFLFKKKARCALTFLAICQPGISKSCTRCNRAFLNEQHIFRISSSVTTITHEVSTTTTAEAQAEAEAEAENGEKDDLAEMLFRRYDTCPYCGGKFVG